MNVQLEPSFFMYSITPPVIGFVLGVKASSRPLMLPSAAACILSFYALYHALYDGDSQRSLLLSGMSLLLTIISLTITTITRKYKRKRTTTITRKCRRKRNEAEQ